MTPKTPVSSLIPFPRLVLMQVLWAGLLALLIYAASGPPPPPPAPAGIAALLLLRLLLLVVGSAAAFGFGMRTAGRMALIVGTGLAAGFGTQLTCQLIRPAAGGLSDAYPFLLQGITAGVAFLVCAVAPSLPLEEKVVSRGRAGLVAIGSTVAGFLLVLLLTYTGLLQKASGASLVSLLSLMGGVVVLMVVAARRLKFLQGPTPELAEALFLFGLCASPLAVGAVLLPRFADAVSSPWIVFIPLVLDCAALALVLTVILLKALEAITPGSHTDASAEAAKRDALTGLFNRRVLDSVAPQLFIDSHQKDRPISLLLLDIDHFKRINDTHGHPAGDEVLRQFAQVLEAQVRATDLVVRYGGEEFAVILAGAPLAPALRLGERIRAAVEQSEFAIGAGQVLRITTSIGVATAFPGEIRTLRDLTEAADKNLYRAKFAGRNRVLANPLESEAEDDE